jgi:hypothetical protein
LDIITNEDTNKKTSSKEWELKLSDEEFDNNDDEDEDDEKVRDVGL